MTASVINILDMVEEIGVDDTNAILADFSTQKSNEDTPLNEDIEIFLKRDALQFAREKKSVTYLVCDEDNGVIVGYFTIAHKALEITTDGLSKTSIKRIERYTKLHKSTNTYFISAFLIAQFGKNYGIDKGIQISGAELMRACEKELHELQHRLGGGIVYLDCEAYAGLINFYENKGFRLFGERISEKDNRRYLQYMKFI